MTSITREQAMSFDGEALAAELETLFDGPLTELTFARFVDRWLQAEADHKTATRSRGQICRLGYAHARRAAET